MIVMASLYASKANAMMVLMLAPTYAKEEAINSPSSPPPSGNCPLSGERDEGGAPSECDERYHAKTERVVALSTGWYDGGSRCGRMIKITAMRLGAKLSETVKVKLRLGAKTTQQAGTENVFKQEFGVGEGEELLKASQCYLSTTAGPIAGLH
ncbi:hypothetical protein NC653_038764 [Populus alba x Populus x berolinensis]|uniref:Ripening-related protein n=1 Tax=Populus alba x Populus x berolinensis TaxID=444605 RepID=A0AAD6LHT3_9ROSI|nr:hypothetical protein NC653_038764 [Populus alba x Populus x berolinensis]